MLILLSPVILLPIPLCFAGSEAKCAYVLAVLGLYWMFEVIPISVAALMPFVMFPMMGILPTDSISAIYFADTNFLLLGGMIVALAVEETQLHERIALAVMCRLGSKPHWLTMGFMVTTAFLSMFMSNTAATAMMIPTAVAIVNELIQQRRIHEPKSYDNSAFVLEQLGSSNEELQTNRKNSKTDGEANDINGVLKLTSKEQRLSNGFLLSICYASNIGGTATLIGTATNLILMGQLDRLFKGRSTGITFLSWMQMAFPPMLISLFLSWSWLCLVFMIDWTETLKKLKKRSKGNKITKKDQTDPIRDILRAKYFQLGTMKFPEIFTTVMFVILTLLWLTRDPGFMTGWSVWFKRRFVTDSCVAILVSIVFFLVPKDLPQLFQKGKVIEYISNSHESILSWHRVESHLQWGLLLLMGGGFALAEGIKSSGLSKLIGTFLTSNLRWISPGGIAAIVAIFVASLTEIASNSATTSIVLPVVISLAQSLCVNPLYLALPATLAASFSFMLPVATPPNALVFGTGRVESSAMLQAGIVMNFLCLAVLLLNLNTWAMWLFQMDSYPEWAQMGNFTSSSNQTGC